MKASQLRQVASSMGPRGASSGSQETSRQLKEAMFLSRVKEIADAERANKLKWSVGVAYIRGCTIIFLTGSTDFEMFSPHGCEALFFVLFIFCRETHLGSNVMTEKEKESVLHQRRLADEAYKVSSWTPII